MGGFSHRLCESLPEGNYCNENVFINKLLQQFYWQKWFTMVFVTNYSYYGLLLQLLWLMFFFLMVNY